jgi:hypothetical protein
VSGTLAKDVAIRRYDRIQVFIVARRASLRESGRKTHPNLDTEGAVISFDVTIFDKALFEKITASS